MSGVSFTTEGGTTISLEAVDGVEGLVLYLDHPDAPDGMRGVEAGRITDFNGLGFQPAMFCQYVLSPETLRAIADLIEQTKES